ncbi:MAG: serine acetyltransferase, partial [Solobacterium sp.]|nr:serine acetyltransferase [Solobacterium sp.]
MKDILEKINKHRDEELCSSCRVNNRLSIIEIIKCIQVIFFPNFYHYKNHTQESAYEKLKELLIEEISIAKEMVDENNSIEEDVNRFLEMLPDIFYLLTTDCQAIYDGDPAAKSKAEIILCYPGFYAILIYRIAHSLYRLNIPFIPRIMSEYAHEKTGIDINPGATIGTHFCIDHGTGIVIGETAILGHHVKLYQGVTIGAKSFEKDEEGNLVKGGKRHPNIGNHVIVYANATILGGDTTIGDHCIIGGNAWIIHSVEPN